MNKSFSKLGFLSSSRKGFSLIELSVVITMAASAMVGVLSWTQPKTSTNAIKAIETRNKMQDIQKAIDSFRAQKKRLPCPADQLMRSDSTRASGTMTTGFGLEGLGVNTTISPATTSSPLIECNNPIGALPVFSIGLDESYINDAWGRRFTYQVADSICNSISCDATAYKTKTGNITIQTTLANGGTKITSNAAYVLVSHGANGSGAYLPSGQKLTDSSYADEIENSNGYSTPDHLFVKATQSQTFDDILAFETRDQIESVTNRRNIRNITVTDCEANSQALSKVTLTESLAMQNGLASANYQITTPSGSTTNIGDQSILGILKATQSICVSYYGAGDSITAVTINGQTWHGAQCPGNKNPHPDGTVFSSTYTAATDSCGCISGLWDGNCTLISLPNPLLWLDAHDNTTSFKNQACTSLANGGDGVKCWKDKSGNGNNATINDHEPTYETSRINGHPALNFDGSSSQLLLPSKVLSNINNDVTVFIVSNVSVTGQQVSVLMELESGHSNPSNIFNIQIPWSDNNVNWYFGNSATNLSTSWGGATNTGYIWSFNNSSSPATMTIWRNGTNITTQNSSGSLSSSSQLGIGNWYGYHHVGVYTGNIGEIIIYNSTLSNANYTTVNRNLGAKWGITVP